MRTKDLTYIGVMAAIVFIGTYSIKLPNIVGGYTHLGDSMIFLAVVLLGKRRAAFASGIGAAMADLIGGYTFWILPTLIIKFLMAWTMGVISDKLGHSYKSYLLGSLVGGALQIVGYAIALFMITTISPLIDLYTAPVAGQSFGLICTQGFNTALIAVPGNIGQTAAGIVIFSVFYKVLVTGKQKFICGQSNR